VQVGMRFQGVMELLFRANCSSRVCVLLRVKRALLFATPQPAAPPKKDGKEKGRAIDNLLERLKQCVFCMHTRFLCLQDMMSAMTPAPLNCVGSLAC
jgi:hypothetical protein